MNWMLQLFCVTNCCWNVIWLIRKKWHTTRLFNSTVDTLKLPIASCSEPWWYSIMPRSWRDWMWFWFNMRAFWKLSIADSKSPSSLERGRRDTKRATVDMWSADRGERYDSQFLKYKHTCLAGGGRHIRITQTGSTCRPVRGFYRHLWSQISTSGPLWMSQWLPDKDKQSWQPRVNRKLQ